MRKIDNDKLTIFLYNWFNLLEKKLTDMTKEVVTTVRQEYKCSYADIFNLIEDLYLKGYVEEHNDGAYSFTPIGFKHVQYLVAKTGYDVNIVINYTE